MVEVCVLLVTPLSLDGGDLGLDLLDVGNAGQDLCGSKGSRRYRMPPEFTHLERTRIRPLCMAEFCGEQVAWILVVYSG